MLQLFQRVNGRAEHGARQLAEGLEAAIEVKEVLIVVRHPHVARVELPVGALRRVAGVQDAGASAVHHRELQAQVLEKGAELRQREAQTISIKGLLAMKEAPQAPVGHVQLPVAAAFVVLAGGVGALQRLNRCLVQLQQQVISAGIGEAYACSSRAHQPRVKRARPRARVCRGVLAVRKGGARAGVVDHSQGVVGSF